MIEMKKIVLLMSLLLCILLAAGCNGEVELTVKDGEAANGFLWENNYSEITITGYEGASNDIVVPAKINGKPVTLIARDAFSGFAGMKSLKIPGSIKKIDGAFQNCTSLETVELAEGIESMNEAFVGCTSIEKIVIPSSVEEMESCFKECTALEEANIPKNVTNAYNAFSRCYSLKDVVIEEGADGLYNTFADCSDLKTLNLPDSYKDGVVLDGLRSLEKITMSEESMDESIHEIGSELVILALDCSYRYDDDGIGITLGQEYNTIEVNGKTVSVFPEALYRHEFS